MLCTQFMLDNFHQLSYRLEPKTSLKFIPLFFLIYYASYSAQGGNYLRLVRFGLEKSVGYFSASFYFLNTSKLVVSSFVPVFLKISELGFLTMNSYIFCYRLFKDWCLIFPYPLL